MLDGMADLVAGHGDGCDRALVVDCLGEPDNPVDRVIMVGQCSANRFDGNVVQTVGIEHTPCCFVSG
ncbi:hypothetical protein D3C73_1336440 [compost metagenome]